MKEIVIFIQKFSPLPGFEPRTSPVPSLYWTNNQVINHPTPRLTIWILSLSIFQMPFEYLRLNINIEEGLNFINFYLKVSFQFYEKWQGGDKYGFWMWSRIWKFLAQNVQIMTRILKDRLFLKILVCYSNRINVTSFSNISYCINCE